MWEKEVFTTGDVAKICNVTIRTVIKWFESKDLEGYKIPGSKDRRIPRENLVEFMRRHHIPLKGMDRPRRKRILIADDDRQLTAFLEQEFKELGLFEVRVSHSGYDAGMVTVDFRPDLLLLDYHLGDIDGVEVTQLIRQNPTVKGIHIIIMSGVFEGRDGKKVIEAGADAFIPKPFEFEELKYRVFKLLELV